MSCCVGFPDVGVQECGIDLISRGLISVDRGWIRGARRPAQAGPRRPSCRVRPSSWLPVAAATPGRAASAPSRGRGRGVGRVACRMVEALVVDVGHACL